MDWTETHRPQSLKDIVGNGPSIGQLRAWAQSWQEGTPDVRAVVLAGPPGTGKTSAALALGRDMGWSVIELNASDARNADTIRRIATAGAVHQTFAPDGSFHQAGEAGGRKLIVLDEADNLYERLSGESAAGAAGFSDRGGKAQIIETIRRTQQPIVLIVNDLYALERGSGSPLRQLALTIKFHRVNVRSIPKALAQICRAEGIQVDEEVLESLAVRAEGDLRSAVRDLQSISMGRTRVGVGDLASLGKRDTTATIFDVVRHVLKGRKLEEVRREVWDVDATPEDLVLWIDENLPKEYKDPHDLLRGYDMLSRADRFLGRTRSTQNYGLWAYAGELATVGVMAQRQHEYKGFAPYGFPQWLSKMSRSRGLRQTKDALAASLATATHQSRRKARSNQVEVFQALFAADLEFAVRQTLALGLSDEQVALLLGAKRTAKDVKAVRAGADALEAEGQARPGASPRGPLAALASSRPARRRDGRAGEQEAPGAAADDEADEAGDASDGAPGVDADGADGADGGEADADVAGAVDGDDADEDEEYGADGSGAGGAAGRGGRGGGRGGDGPAPARPRPADGQSRLF